ncbi:MAG: hypothetical protein MI923_21225 [Phycisphaerales bacterium]|nr:hypothetical protein [Phycisphaerales bacterium]
MAKRVSEKTLELNVSAELLGIFRKKHDKKAYLRGLTQAEENAEGVDVFVRLSPRTVLYALQFKAPKNSDDGWPYRFTINEEQHRLLYDLTRLQMNSVYYVFPCYAQPQKVYSHAPRLLKDTYMVPVEWFDPDVIFEYYETRTVRCYRNKWVQVNPEFRAIVGRKQLERTLSEASGIPATKFLRWYEGFTEVKSPETGKRSPWLCRGLRVVICKSN